MKISLNWLKEYIPNIKKNNIFVNELTALGLEVSSAKRIKKDTIIDIDMTPNRADCLSIIGIARDVSPLYNKIVKYPECVKLNQSKTNNLSNINKSICPAYSALVIMGIDNKIKTPTYIRTRLDACGISCINFIVDVLNYVMLEVGQPMHAFDKDKFDGKVCVRYAKKNEKINALDGEEYSLSTETPVITDNKSVQAIAGIIGSTQSSVNLKTKNIIIESAFFTPSIIRKTAKSYRLQTDASYRFERGVDPEINKYAIARVLSIIKNHMSINKYYFNNIKIKKIANHVGKTVKIHPSEFSQLLGTDIQLKFIIKTLKYLGFKPKMNKSFIQTTVPSHRFDINISHDLVEEVARIYGYDNFKPILKVDSISYKSSKLNKINSYSNILTSRGYNETISFSFLPKGSQKKYSESNIIEIMNPISSDKSEMRLTLIHSLLRTCQYNHSRQHYNVKLFEYGKTYKKSSKSKIIEQNILAGLISGINSELNIKSEQKDLTFFDLKGDLISLFPNLSFKPSIDSSYLDKSCQANIYQGKNIIGYCGEPKKEIYNLFDLKNKVFCFEIMTDKLNNEESIKYSNISIFPKIKRDLTVLIDDKILGQDIIDAIERKSFNYMINSKISDIFYNEAEFGPSMKSMSFEFIFQDKKGTLTDNTINSEMDKIFSFIKQSFKAKIRT